MPETYVHRIGRTGRAGLGGVALSFCDEEEKPYLKDIQKLILKSIPVIEDQPYPLVCEAPAIMKDEQKKTTKEKPRSSGYYRRNIKKKKEAMH